ncbi:hypothetical protein [Macrococcus equi]|uniref:hypothetical protein n=1 Tax=Macrococcus equi TaxID=3395462 RepID=UPI0039BE953C
MRKCLLVLTIFLLFLGGCGKPSEQKELSVNDVIKNEETVMLLVDSETEEDESDVPGAKKIEKILYVKDEKVKVYPVEETDTGAGALLNELEVNGLKKFIERAEEISKDNFETLKENEIAELEHMIDIPNDETMQENAEIDDFSAEKLQEAEDVADSAEEALPDFQKFEYEQPKFYGVKKKLLVKSKADKENVLKGKDIPKSTYQEFIFNEYHSTIQDDLFSHGELKYKFSKNEFSFRTNFKNVDTFGGLNNSRYAYIPSNVDSDALIIPVSDKFENVKYDASKNVEVQDYLE